MLTRSMKFSLLRLHFVSANLSFSLAWNTFVLAGTRNCCLKVQNKLQKHVFKTAAPTTAASLEPFQSWNSSFYQGVSSFSFPNSPQKSSWFRFSHRGFGKIGNCSAKEGVLLIFILKTLSNGISLLYASQEELSLIQSNLQIH